MSRTKYTLPTDVSPVAAEIPHASLDRDRFQKRFREVNDPTWSVIEDIADQYRHDLAVARSGVSLTEIKKEISNLLKRGTSGTSSQRISMSPALSKLMESQLAGLQFAGDVFPDSASAFLSSPERERDRLALLGKRLDLGLLKDEASSPWSAWYSMVARLHALATEIGLASGGTTKNGWMTEFMDMVSEVSNAVPAPEITLKGNAASWGAAIARARDWARLNSAAW